MICHPDNAFEMLESRTMLSAVALPHAAAVVKHPVVSTAARHVTTVKTTDPAVTDKSISYKNFSSDPLFASNGPAMSDINQGYLGDCYLLSTLASVVKTDPGLIKKDIVADGNGIFTVTFGAGTKINENADLPVFSDGQLAYARLGNQDSLWVALYEKAFAQYQNPKANSYGSINGGWMSEAFSGLGLKSQTIVAVRGAAGLVTTLAADLKAGDFTTFGTVSTLAGSSPLIAGHAYEVNSVQVGASGSQTITLRNPWGNAVADDGMITVTAQQLYEAFAGVVTARA
jgi:hypothetical protein